MTAAADDLRVLSAAATEGPWKFNPQWDPDSVWMDINGDNDRTGIANAQTKDAELIVWLRNHADAIVDLIDATAAVVESERTQEHGPTWYPELPVETCMFCEGAWPCATQRLRDALAALEADR